MKYALITGANKSIGFETAKILAASGYFVFIGSRNEAKGAEAVKKLNELKFQNVEAVELDVTNTRTINSIKELLSSKIPHLDVLINNAGISGGMPQPASTVPLETVRTVFETNFFGVIQTTQAFIEMLKKSEQPRIVNVSSGLGSLTDLSRPDWKYYDVKLTAYCSSKTALNAYTVMLAYELRDTNFKVNSVDPGYTATDFNQHRGDRKAEDAAKTVARYALLDSTGPTGKFFSEEGEVPW